MHGPGLMLSLRQVASENQFTVFQPKRFGTEFGVKLRDRTYNRYDELLAEIDRCGFSAFPHNGRHSEQGSKRFLRIYFRIAREILTILKVIMVEFRIRNICRAVAGNKGRDTGEEQK